MAIALEFIDLIVPISKIRDKYGTFAIRNVLPGHAYRLESRNRSGSIFSIAS